MRILSLICLLFLVNSHLLAQQSREEKLLQLKNREDVKITEVEKDLLKIEYLNGKVIIKNIADYKPSATNKVTYSPNYDSTIIDLRTIDTTLYYQKYSYWQEVPLGNFRSLLVGDINNNNLPELYGQMKDYYSGYSDIVIFEEHQQGGFDSVYRYDSTNIARSIYDVDKDGMYDLHIVRNYDDTVTLWNVNSFLFYRKSNDTCLAKELSFIFQPRDTNTQQNDNYFGDWDLDNFTDQVFIIPCCPGSIFIYEYNPSYPSFDSVYQFDYSSLDLYYGGFSIGDFDEDSKTEFFAGSVHGKVLSIENNGNNSYATNWQGMVETYNAYLLNETNDLDGNGKNEIWVGGDAFYSGIGITRITLFEANGNDSYEAVGRIDLLGVFSFDAGNIQVLDIDKDGKQEVMICIDQHVIILKFSGSTGHQVYDVFYIKQNDYENNHFVYEGATMYDLSFDGKEEIIVNMYHIIQNVGLRLFSHIFKAEFTLDISDTNINSPGNFYLYSNYPNPFNSQTTIKFDILEFSFVTIKIYNIIGKEVTTLFKKEFSPGRYTVSWDGKGSDDIILPSEVYFIRLNAGKYTKTIKAVLLK